MINVARLEMSDGTVGSEEHLAEELVASSHGAHQNPQAIDEVRGIIKLDAR